MNGMNQNIQQRILAIDPNITFYGNQISEGDLIQKLNPQLHLQLNSLTGDPVNEKIQIHSFSSYDLILRTVDGQFKGAQVVGYDQTGLDFWNSQLVQLKEKEKKYEVYESQYDLNLEKNEIAIGIDLARSLQVLEGDQVTLIPAETLLLSQLETPNYERATIKKILTTDLYDLDSKLVLFNKSHSFYSLKKSLSEQMGFHIWASQKENISALAHRLKSENKGRVETWHDKNSDLFFALFMEKTVIGVFLALAGLIASSSILTVLVMMVSQKRSDIAILKTLGLSKNKTLILFMQMGLWISLSALLLGSVIGIGISYYIQFNPLKILPDVYYDSSIPAQVDLGFAMSVILGVVVLALVGCFIPSRATLKIEPAILLKRN